MNEFEAIYDAVRAIPRGRVLAYGEVGAQCGASARTVGWAMRTAPEGLPWWRVVGADGYLRTARRSPLLQETQRRLLEAEGVHIGDDDRVAAEFFGADR